MGIPPVPVGIILYVNRSGSTLLSRLLADTLDGVFVFPELRFTLDLLVARRAGRPITDEALLRMMRADQRLASLGLTDDHLAQIAARHGADDLHGLMVALATAVLGKRPTALILKLEQYAAFVAELDAAFDAPVLIHAMRDPRAVVRSMRATPVPEKPGFDMARGSLRYAARHWRDSVARVTAIAAKRTVIIARYETLATPSPPVLADIASALGVSLAPVRRPPPAPAPLDPAATADGAPTASASFVVAPIDAALHRNVHDPFDATRAEAWQTALTPRAVALIESWCGAEMDRAGYPRAAPHPASRAAKLAAYIQHHAAMGRHAVRTAWRYARRPGGLRQLRDRIRLARSVRTR